MKQMPSEIRRGSNWFQFMLIQNANEKNGRSSWFLFVVLMLFCCACNSVPENWHTCVNRGRTYLLNTTAKRGGYVALNIQPLIQTLAPSSIRNTKDVTQRRVLLVSCMWLVRIAKYVEMVHWTSSYPNVALGRCRCTCLVGSLRSFGGGCQSHHFKGPARYILTKATILYVICL